MRAAPLFILLVTIFTSCHHKSLPFHTGYPYILAATDDTTLNYAIDIFPSHRFAYTITHRTQQPDAQREFYHGTWEYRSDTIFVRYQKGHPPGMTNYLLRSFPSGWLIQCFNDGRPRVFLRIFYRRLR